MPATNAQFGHLPAISPQLRQYQCAQLCASDCETPAP
jgi:hypothetical protein